MARDYKPVAQPDGSFDFRLTLKPDLCRILELAGAEIAFGSGDRVDHMHLGSKLLVRTLEHLLVEGKLGALGEVWARVTRQLPNATQGAWLNTFDQRVLHLDAKRVSGFVGVVAHGSRFMARGRHPTGVGEILIGTYRTGLEAAIARYQHYIRHVSLCYGQAEDEIQAFRDLAPDLKHLPDSELWPQAKQHAADVGRLDAIFGPGTVSLEPGPREPQLAAQAAMWAELDAKVTEPNTPTDGEHTAKLESIFAGLFSAPRTPEIALDEPPKRGRPFKPCPQCGLKLKTFVENGQRSHRRSNGMIVPCIPQTGAVSL